MSNTNTGYDPIVTNSENGMNPLPPPSEEHKLAMKLNQIYMNEKDKREQDKRSRKKKKLSERIKRLARSDLLEINETIRNFHNGIGRAAKDTVRELRAIKQLLKDKISKKNIQISKKTPPPPEGMYTGGKRTRKRRGRGKNNGNILKKANIEMSKQRLARMGLRQRSGNKTEKKHDREMSKLRLAYMGLRQRSQNNNTNKNSGESKNSTRTRVLAKTNNLKMGGGRKKKTRRKKRKKRGGKPYVGEVSEEANRYWRARAERERREREEALERSRRQRERLREERERRERARIMSRAGQLFPNRNFTLEEAKNAVETHNLHRQFMYNVLPEATEVQKAVEFDGGKIRSMLASKAEPVLTGIPMATVVGNRVRVGGKRKTKKRRKK